MWKTFYIKPEELALLYHRSSFQQILKPGTHRYFGFGWSIERYNLNQPQAQIKNLDLLLRDFRAELEVYLTIVTTEFNEAAVLKIGQEWLVMPPNETRSFWRGFISVEIQKFDLDQSLALPMALVDRLRGVTVDGLKKYQISDTQLGLAFVQKNFAGTLAAGEHGFFDFARQVDVHTLDITNPLPIFPQVEVLLDRHPDFVANYCTSIELEAQELGIVRHKGKMVAILPPSTRQLFWQGINIEVVDLSFQAKLSPLQVQELVNGSPEIAQIAGTNIYAKNIPASHAGLLFLNEEFQSVLPSGFHAWWKYGRALRVEVTDLRLQSIEVSGQDILSKDKVPLRLNLIAGIRVTDPLQAQANVIRRREETAATRSMLNTAKVMEDNPVALRLKELEVLERIAEKIDRIQVNGSLDSILTDLIKIDRAKE